MKLHKDLNNLPQFRNAVITIGSFDGVHCGHRKIIKKVKDLALATGGESIIITFHPHPRQIIYPKDNTLRLLTTTEEKIRLLEKTGIDHLVIVPFTFEFSQLNADEYIQKFLVGKFEPKHIVIGYDHRFGMNRQGDINFLRWHERNLGYKVVEIKKAEIDELAVSSTRIREAVESSDVARAARLLGNYFTLTGKVVKGQQIGATIGYPTANLEIREAAKLFPPDGVYACFVKHDEERMPGMLYIGKRPTLKKYQNRTVEVNIFDFKKSIYEEELEVELVQFIRPDEDLKDLDALKDQISKDQEAAASILQKAEKQVVEWQNLERPSVAVVILNYNGKNFLEKHLPSVLKTRYANCRVYVADNASKDDSVAYLEKNFPKTKIIHLEQNFGFAKGYNLALQDLDEDFFVLLNSDVEVPDNWLEPMVSVMEKDTSIAALQPKIRALGQPEYFEYAGAAGGWIDSLGYPFARGRIFDTVEKDNGQYDNTVEIFWASGCCMMVRGPLFKGFGGFDNDFFAHLEEIDLCWRFKRAGYKVVFTPKSTVFHLGGGTLGYHSPYKTYLNFRNSYYTLLKNEGVIKLAFLLPLRLMMDTLAAFNFLMQAKWLHAQAVIASFFSVFLALVLFIKKRLELELLLDKIRISPQSNRHGILPGSIVLKYFVLGKKFFSKL
ncbi:MAG: bifunctional riboflavin kinase/FAD synthetase [Bacteroidetes bacterium]|nr:bifunctional riboflavin kinase/FAD synthetase [Bacteroidota bacterium]